VSNFNLWELAVQPIDGNINHYSINLVGTDGSGKTTFMNSLMKRQGRTFTCGFEDRFKSVVGLKVIQFKNWKEFLQFKKQTKKQIKEGKALPFDSTIIDTVGEAAKMCKKYIMDENGWDELKGDQYNVIGQGFTDEIRDLRNMGLIVNFVSHDKQRKITTATGNEYDQVVPDTINQIKHLVQGDCDFIMYMEVVNETDEDGKKHEFRRLWLHGHPMLKLKVPLYGLPEYIDFDDVEEGVDKFLEAFNEGVRVTQKIQDDGGDVSNPNADNNKLPVKEPVKVGLEDDEDEDEGEEIGTEVENEDEIEEEVTSSEEDVKPMPDIETLREEAKAVRMAIKSAEGLDVAKAKVKEFLGSEKIKDTTNAEALMGFIEKYKA